MTIKQNLLFDTDSQSTQEQNNQQNDSHIVIGPGNMFLLFLSTVLFTASGILAFPFSMVAVVLSAPLYSIFSYKIGNRYSFVPPILAFVISLIVSGSVASSITVILAAAMSFCIMAALGRSPEKAKTSAVIRCTVAFIIYLIAQIIIFVISNDITSQGAFAEYINNYFDSVKELITQMYSSGFEQLLADSELSNISGLKAISPETLTLYIDAMIYQSKAMLPATIVLWMLGISYVSCSLLPPFAKLCGARNMLEGKIYSITISGICLITYFIASLGMIFSNGPDSYGFRNIVSVISPCFMLCGVKQIGEFFKTKIPRSAILVLKIASVLAAFVLGNLGTTLLTVLGMYYATHTHGSSDR